MGEPVPDDGLERSESYGGLLGNLRAHEAERVEPLVGGRYRIVRPLGEGGMGAIFQAEDTELGRQVVLKRLSNPGPVNPKQRARFESEAKAAARLNDPNVIQTHELLEDDGRLYLVMEWVDGTSLGERLTAGPMATAEVVRIARAIASGLAHAHGHGVIHRDLKPDNVMLADDGRVLLIDFGLAKRLDSSQALTRSGQFMGSPNYVPPEQIDASKHADERSDVYGFGACLYQMLTGSVPFDGDHLHEVMQKILTVDPLPPRRLNPDVDRVLEQVCMRCLRKLPEERYGSAEELISAIEEAGRPPTPVARGWAVVGFAAVAAVGVGVVALSRVPPAEPRPTEEPAAANGSTPTPTPAASSSRSRLRLRESAGRRIRIPGRAVDRQDRTALSVTPEHVTAVIGRLPYTVTRWDRSAGGQTGRWRIPFEDAAIGPRGRQAAVVLRDHVRWFDLSTQPSVGKRVRLPGWSEPWDCKSLGFGLGGRVLILGSPQRGIAVLDLPGLTPRVTFADPLHYRGMAIDPGGRWLVAGYGGGNAGVGGVGVWDLQQRRNVQRRPFPGTAQVVFVDAARVALGGKTPFVEIARCGPRGLTDAVFLNDGGALGREFGGIGVARPKAHRGFVTALAATGDRLVTAARNAESTAGEVRLWDLRTLRLLQTLTLREAPAAVAADDGGVWVLTTTGFLLHYDWSQ